MTPQSRNYARNTAERRGRRDRCRELWCLGRTQREIAQELGIARCVVCYYLTRAKSR